MQLRPQLQALAASTDYFPGGKQNLCNLPRVFDPSIPGCADACAFGFIPDIDRYCLRDPEAQALPGTPVRRTKRRREEDGAMP